MSAGRRLYYHLIQVQSGWNQFATHIERFNNTLRQRVSRLVREALSFSKRLVNHIGAIKLFICHYNLMKAPALYG